MGGAAWAACLVAGAALCAAQQAPPPVGQRFVQLDVLDHEQYRDLQEKRLGRSAYFVLGPRPPPAPLGGDREHQCADKQETTTSVTQASAASRGLLGDCAPHPDVVSAHCRSCVVQPQPPQEGGVLLTCADCQHRHPTRTCAVGGRANRFEPMYRVAAAAFMVYEVERKAPETVAVAIREVMPAEEEDKAVPPEHLEVDDTDDVLVDHQVEAPAKDDY